MERPTKTKRKRRGIQSIDTGIRLLETLENADGPLALKDLNAQSELDPSSAHRYLASFVRRGLMRQEANSRYDFGPLALQIGLAAMRRIEPESIDRVAFERAVERARKTRLAFADSSVNPELAAVGAPVLHWNGEAVAAVVLLSPDRELAGANHPGAVALRRLCDCLSKDFGARQIREAA
jgi:DNA-binding IclR family transcriptional regulator